MDGLNKHLREDAEFRIRLAGGDPDGSSSSDRNIDPDADAPDILSAGFGIVPL